jgi:regulator of replication initiation timing
MDMFDPEDLKNQLQKALEESKSLREENERLKKLLGLYPEDRVPPKPRISEPSTPYTPANQVTNDSQIPI